MPIVPNEPTTYTQRFSSNIDDAYDAYRQDHHANEDLLYRAFRAQARHIIRCRLHLQDSDLEHNITTRAFLSLQTFREKSRVSTWFYRLAQNEVNDALRNIIQERERRVVIPAREQEYYEPDVVLEAKPVNLDAAIELEKLVRGLPPEQAEVLVMVLEGHSVAEIAVKTGEPLGTIRGRYRLAKQKAKKKSSRE